MNCPRGPRSLLLLLPFLALPAIATSCARARPPASPAASPAPPSASASASASASLRHEFTHPALGTTFRVVVYCRDRDAVRRAEAVVIRRLAQLDETLNDASPSSELSQLYANAGLGTVRASDDLYTFLRLLDQIARRAPAGYDLTAGAAAGLWDRAAAERRLPSKEELEEVRPLSGRTTLVLDPIARTAHLPQEGARLDLRGAVDGYACDRVLAALRNAGFASALVEAGDATLAVGDAPPGRPGWRIEVRDADPKSSHRFVTLKQQAVASSGRLGDAVTIDGAAYARLVNPLTGVGSRNVAPVTVVARRAWHAAALARAASVLGQTDGQKLLVSTPSARGWFHGSQPADAKARKKKMKKK